MPGSRENKSYCRFRSGDRLVVETDEAKRFFNLLVSNRRARPARRRSKIGLMEYARMNELVEQIVREVMSRLALERAVAAPADRAPAAAVKDGEAAACSAAAERSSSQAASSGGRDAARTDGRQQAVELPPASVGGGADRSNDQLYVPGKVVALADLADHLDRVRCVSVTSGAVVTPAVRDELQRRGIALRYVSGGGSGACETPIIAAELSVQLVIHQGCFDERALRTLRIDGASIAVASSECVIEACDAAARAVLERQALAVVMTRYAAAALCLANRTPQVRAVAARDSAELKSAMSMVGANVVVIDPDAVGSFIAGRLLREVAVIGRRACPRAFGSRLN